MILVIQKAYKFKRSGALASLRLNLWVSLFFRYAISIYLCAEKSFLQRSIYYPHRKKISLSQFDFD
jgi:hypothetical protein